MTHIHIKINSREETVLKGITVCDIVKNRYPLNSVIILNTVIGPEPGTVLKDQDDLIIFEKGKMPSRDQMELFFLARQKKEVTESLKASTVGIAGLGGLGSVVAENLARAGVGHLILVDFDIVEPSNLNRQRYFVNQIGFYKTDAIKENLSRINPYVKLTLFNEKVTASNVKRLFSECNIVAECFDKAQSKAELISSVRSEFPDIFVVGASGVAGCSNEKDIKTHRISDRILVIGDMKTEVKDGHGLVATRVGVAASMQSHVILRILIGDLT